MSALVICVQTTCDYFRKWRLAGIWEQLNTALREQVRSSAGRQPTPSGAIIGQPIGQDHRARRAAWLRWGKKINGRKRHLLVETLGFLLRVVVHPANVHDRDGAPCVLGDLGSPFPRLQQIWADQGYTGPVLQALAAEQGWRLEIVRRTISRLWHRLNSLAYLVEPGLDSSQGGQ
jgi:putative transposase